MAKGSVKLDIDKCKACGYCIKFCPGNVLALSGEKNALGYPYVEPKEPEKCTGCGICYRMCPDAVITVLKA